MTDLHGPRGGVQLRLGVVVTLMAVAFAGGFLARGTAAGGGDPINPLPAVGGVDAPALNDSQLRGDLPPGHPPVSGQPVPSAGTSAAPAGSPSPSPSPSAR